MASPAENLDVRQRILDAARAEFAERGFGAASVRTIGEQAGVERGDAAWAVLTRDAKTCTGNFLIDDEVLAEEGVTDLDQYAVEPGTPLFQDFFLD